MKKSIIVLLIIFCSVLSVFSYSDNNKYQLAYILSNGNTLFGITFDKSGWQLRKLFPPPIISIDLPPHKSVKLPVEITDLNQVAIICDNELLIFSDDLKPIKKIPLPSLPEAKDYLFDYSNIGEYSIIRGGMKPILFRNNKIIELDKSIDLFNNRVELKNNEVLINKINTHIKLKSFELLVGLTSILDSEHIVIFNTLFDSKGEIISILPNNNPIYYSLNLKNGYALGSEKMIIINKKGEIEKIIKAQLVGEYQNRIVILIDKSKIGLLSIDNKKFEIIKLTEKEEILEIEIVGKYLFYYTEKHLKTNDSEIMSEKIYKKDLEKLFKK